MTLRVTLAIIFFSGAITTLLGLSYWQVERLKWKNDIIERLNIEYQKDPAAHSFNFDDLQAMNNHDLPLQYGQVIGHFEHDKQIFAGPKPHEGEIGYQIITPLRLQKGGYILVNRGWISLENKKTLKTENTQTSQTVTGVFRKPEWNSFTPNNSPENNVWSKLDIQEIAHVKDLKSIAPVMLYAEHSVNTIIIPQPQKWYPRNKHKQYAIFWATMALAFISVFGLFVLKNKRT